MLAEAQQGTRQHVAERAQREHAQDAERGTAEEIAGVVETEVKARQADDDGGIEEGGAPTRRERKQMPVASAEKRMAWSLGKELS